MKTDKSFYQIFQACPTWWFELIGKPVPEGRLDFSSMALKAVQRTADGVLVPEDKRQPIWIAEFETNPDGRAVPLALIAMGMLAFEHYPRLVQGAVIYLGPVPKYCAHWPIIHCYELSQLVAGLRSDHPMHRVLSPLMVDADAELASRAANDYHAVQHHAALSPIQRSTLCEVFYDLLIQRFSNLTSKEIHQMIVFRDIETTVLGKDLIAIGEERGEKRGEKRGREEGREEGREQGITFVVLRHVSRRFGALPVATAERIHDLDYLQLEQLADAILDFADMADLEAWLAALPAKAVR